jgi:serine/threonine-protein kinase HipA
MSVVTQLQGYTPQGFAGDLIRESQFVWRYSTQNPEAELSLTMPLRAQSYNSHMPHPIFAMNLPEGAQYDRFQQRFAKQFSKFNEMAILSLMGQDQIGRISLQQEGFKASSASIGLGQLLKSKAGDGLFDFLLGEFFDRGIAGVQPKVLLPDGDLQPTTANRETAYASNLIVKTGGQDFPFLSQNEYLCMSVAKIAGLDVPDFYLSEDGSLFIMRRFDRPAVGVQFGFEDMAVLSGATYDERGHYKYRGTYEGLVRYIRHYCSANALVQTDNFFSYFALSCMVRNGDAHLKNFGLLYNHPNDAASTRLAPLFDVVTTSVYGDNTMALKLNKSNSYPTRKELIAFGKDVCLVKKPETVIERIADAMTEVSKTHADLVPRSFAKPLFDEWDSASRKR